MDPKLSRRALLKSAVAAGAGAAVAGQVKAAAPASSDAPTFRVAGYDYDRVKAIADGRAGIEGADIAFQAEDIYTANRKVFGPEQTYDITEVGLIPYVTKFVNEGFRNYRLVPVFPSRTFRHRNLFVNVDAGIEKPTDLRGRKVGTPGYGSSANTWIRGLLLDEYGVKADEIEWVETAKSSDGGPVTGGGGFSAFEGKKSPYFLPDGFPLSQGPPGVDESELLLTRGCDALIAPIAPRAFKEGNPKIRTLFPDPGAAERAYFEKTGVFPIMHAVAIRADVLEANPGLPAAVYAMYERAKQLAIVDLETIGALKVSLPWAGEELARTRALMGADYWRYGLEANRKELDLVMRYVHEQGLVKERRGFEQMFVPVG